MLNQMIYRANQFFHALLCRVRTDQVVILDTHLSPAQQALFYRMHRIDQRHCLDVFHTLHQAGHRDPALLQAALLHDVGKASAKITILHRVVVALIKDYSPGLLDRLARRGGDRQTAWTIHLSHARVGAQLVASSSPPDVEALIAEHHGPASQDERLAALRWADGQH